MSHFRHMGGIHEMYQFCLSLLTTTDFRASWKIAAEDKWPSVHWETLFKVNKQLSKAAEHLYPISEHYIQTDDTDGIRKHDSPSAKCLLRISAALRLFPSFYWEKQASLWIRSASCWHRIVQNVLGVLRNYRYILSFFCWCSRFITSDGLFSGRNWLWLV